MEILSQNVTLTHLKLEYIEMSNYSAKLISNLVNLEHLNVREARNEIQDDAMSSILNNCKKLKELNIMNANVLSKYIVIEPDSLTKLEHLSITCRPRTSDTVMNYIFMNCKNLKSIDIQYGEFLSNKTLNILGDLKNLKNMDLIRAAIDDSVLYHYHDLKVLDCSFCPKITDSGIKHILDSSPNLEKLRVESTNVTLRTLSYALYLSTCRKKKLRLGLSSHIKVNPESTNDIDVWSIREKFNNEYFELV
ncbi:F-box/LRR-repeat protein 20-like [Aphidius gifuensis]|uniref:F-box/LRR-repeat protein 20-like n=1 Tax=Aphidius gifuensis TaxID=684658 RepID=UPI001CDD6756|nr:F-box/LRR-repeat protein 20-like [Aphidius gifuensis]